MNKSEKLEKLTKIIVISISTLALITLFFMINTDTADKPLVIYVAENDHGDMSYGSLIEKIIKDCQEKGLSTKTFSEFSSQTAKSQKQIPRTPDLMNLTNSQENIEKTAKFLDSQFISMGNIQARISMWSDTQKRLPAGTTPDQLFLSLKSNVDNPELHRLMEDDLKTGAISGANKIGDLENFYAHWRSVLHYKQTHEEMAKDVRNNLQTKGNADVIIIVAGSPHLPGLNQQLHEFRDSSKIVVGNFPEGLDPLNNLIYSGSPEFVAGIGKIISFEVDLDKKEAIVPYIIKRMIDEKSESKAKSQKHKIDALDPDKKPSARLEKSYVEKMIGTSRAGSHEV